MLHHEVNDSPRTRRMTHRRRSDAFQPPVQRMFNAFNARSETGSAFRRVFANSWLWGAIALSALLQVAVVHVRFLGEAFSTAPLSLDQWLVCLAMASAVLWTAEGRKLVLRFVERRSSQRPEGEP